PQGQRHRRAAAASLAASLEHRLNSLVKTGWLAAYDYPNPSADHLSCSCRTHSPKGELLRLALLTVVGAGYQSGDVLGLCLRPLAC
ncbi:hypothetical protein, partial [Burkholderia ambifaria]